MMLHTLIFLVTSPIYSRILVDALASTSAATLPSRLEAEDPLKDVRFCNVNQGEQTFCKKVVEVLNRKQLGAQFSCVMENTIQDCFLAIEKGRATLRNFAIGEIYDGHLVHHLKVLTHEMIGDNSGSRYSVITVRKEFCEAGDVSLSRLQGKSLCSSGYSRPSGWQTPVAYLISTGIMPVVSRDPEILDDVESVTAFFGNVCAAGVHANGPVMTRDGYGKLTAKLCSACKTNCTTKDPYFTYKGALRCLVEGAGDVMFSGPEGLLGLTSDGSNPSAVSWSTKPKEHFRLICPSGGCARVEEYAVCNVGRHPPRALMVRADYPAVSRLQAALVAAGNESEFRALVFNTSSNPEDYLLRAVSKGIVSYSDDTLTYLGPVAGTLKLLDQLRTNNKPPTGGSSSGQISTSWQLGALVVGALLGGALLGILMYWMIAYEYQRRNGVAQPAESEKDICRDECI